MKNFDDWFTELKSEEVWFEQATLHHKPETVEATARQIWVNGLAEGEAWKVIPMKEHRRHLFNKLSKITPDKVKKQWWLKEEEKPKEEWIPLTGEARAKRLQEYMDAIQAAPMMQPVAPLSAREKLNQDVRPLPPEIHEPSEVEKRAAYLGHLKRTREARTVTFLEAYPDAPPEEIAAYLEQYREIDNPLGL